MGDYTLLSILFIGLSYLSAGVFFFGLTYKLWGYATTPSPLKIPTTPQPTTVGGVIGKNVVNIATFAALFKGNRWTWVGGYALHLILLLVFVRHLRYFVEPVSGLIVLAQPFGMWAGVLLPLPLLYLMGMRKTVDRLNYITSKADMLILTLLLLIALTGISLRFISHGDVVAVKEFIMGLITFSPVNMPTHPAFMAHYMLVLALGFYFPFSKLLHSGAVFFSPTHTQVENVREVRHVNPWAEQKEG